MAFDVTTVSAFIAGLSITGYQPDGASVAVTIRDYNGVTASADVRACPILQPDVNADIATESWTYDSFGPGSVAKQTLVYLLPYVLLYSPAGGERGPESIMPNQLATVQAVLTALGNNAEPGAGGVSVEMVVSSFQVKGLVTDPANNQFRGALITLRVTEFIN